MNKNISLNVSLSTAVIACALRLHTSIALLTYDDFLCVPELASFADDYQRIVQQVGEEFEQKLAAGRNKITEKVILHTAPHHDDILLGYFPYALRNIAGNQNHVLYVTSGANGVSDHYLAEHLGMSKKKLEVYDGAAQQEIKYRLREAESEKKWLLCAGDAVAIKHLRAEFYEQVDAAGSARAMQRDIARVVDYLHDVQPDIITMLVDPVGIGPSTHHRSQQVLTAAIAQWQSKMSSPSSVTMLGYRNIWSSFSLHEASMIISVTQTELDYVEAIFNTCFATQKQKFIMSESSDGHQGQTMQNFAQQASYIQHMQLQQLQALVPESNLTGMAGAIFLQELPMPLV